MSMRIVHVVRYLNPALGFQEPYLAWHQKRRGHNVLVVTSTLLPTATGFEVRPEGSADEFGITVIRLPFGIGIGSRRILKGLERVLGQLGPDVVHCHRLYGPEAWQVARAKSRVGYALVFDTHDAEFHYRRERGIRGVLLRSSLYLFQFALAPHIRRHADAIAAISEPERDLAVRWMGLDKSAIPIIRLGVDTSEFQPLTAERVRLRGELGFSPSSIVLICTGKLMPSKNVDVVIRALGHLVDHGLDSYLLCVGTASAPYQRYLEELAATLGMTDRLRFLPWAERSDLPGLYSAADICVWGGDPSIGILESMACALPIILGVGEDAGLRQHYAFLVSDDNGRLVASGDARDLAMGVQSLVGEAKEGWPTEAGGRSRDLVVRCLTWDRIAAEFEALYDQARGTGTPPDPQRR